MPDIRSEICRRFIIHFWQFKQIQGKFTTWRNKWIMKNYFVGCYAPWSKDGVYAVTNVVLEISTYIQMFILVRTAFFLEGIQMILQVTYGLGTKFLKKCMCKCLHWHNSPPPVMCEHSLWHNPILPVCMQSHFDGSPPPLSANIIIEYPCNIFSKDTKPFNFIKRNVIWKLVYKIKYVSQIKGGLNMFFGNLRIRFFFKLVGSIVNNI